MKQMTDNKIDRNELAEFTGQIIDIFEDFLEEKNVQIENPEREHDLDGLIYGTDYGDIQTRIEELLENWDIVKDDTVKTVHLSMDIECEAKDIHILKEWTHHVDRLLDLDSYPEIKKVSNVKVDVIS